MSEGHAEARTRAAEPCDGLAFRCVAEGRAARLYVRGEVDLATAGTLEATVRQLCDDGFTSVDLFLTEVRFCDGAGFGALVSAQALLHSRGGTLTVHDPCWSLRRIMDIFGLTETLDRRAPQPPRPRQGQAPRTPR